MVAVKSPFLHFYFTFLFRHLVEVLYSSDVTIVTDIYTQFLYLLSLFTSAFPHMDRCRIEQAFQKSVLPDTTAGCETLRKGHF